MLKLGSFWGMTAPMFVMAFPNREDALTAFRMLGTTVSSKNLQGLREELINLAQIENFVEYTHSICVSDGATNCFQGAPDGDEDAKECFLQEFVQRAAVHVIKCARNGVYYDTSGLEEKAKEFLENKNKFRMVELDRIVKKFVSSLEVCDSFSAFDAASQFDLSKAISNRIVLDTRKYTLSEEEKRTVQYFVNRLEDIHWFIAELAVENVSDEMVFNIPFFNLIQRKPASLRFVVFNYFELLKNNTNQDALFKVVGSIRNDLNRFRELCKKYVNVDHEIEKGSKNDCYTLFSGNTELMDLFWKLEQEPYFVQLSDFMEDDLRVIAQLYYHVKSVSEESLPSILGFSVHDWDAFGESVCKLGICGINKHAMYLFLESVSQVVLSFTQIYRSESVLKELQFITDVEIEPLIDTIIPVGEVI